MAKRPVALYLDDVIRTRKAHPCGGDTWRVVRLGAEIGMRCETCGRKVLLPRAELERRIKAFVSRGPDAAGDTTTRDMSGDATMPGAAGDATMPDAPGDATRDMPGDATMPGAAGDATRDMSGDPS